MASKLGLAFIACTLGACQYTPNDMPDRGIAPVNVPVVERADYVFDAAAPGGTLLAGEGARLDGWFQGLGLGYGDSVYVDGAFSEAARYEVAQIAGRYGMLVEAGAPMTPGAVAPGAVRVVVSRNRASVPGCPNWDVPSAPNYNNRSSPNLGCGINSNLAAMVANPQDLVHGREGSGVLDTQTATKAVSSYRSATPTGNGGLEQVNTKGGN